MILISILIPEQGFTAGSSRETFAQVRKKVNRASDTQGAEMLDVEKNLSRNDTSLPLVPP